MLRVFGILLSEIIYSFAYVKGLIFSHISAYNTLKNLRISLQGKLEKQPLGNIESLGTGRIKKVFTEDIDMIELLLAHAIPEGIANILIPFCHPRSDVCGGLPLSFAFLYSHSRRDLCHGHDDEAGQLEDGCLL